MDNAPYHPEVLSDRFSNVKVVFLPKNQIVINFVRKCSFRKERLDVQVLDQEEEEFAS